MGQIATGINSVIQIGSQIFGQVEKTIEMYKIEEQAIKSLETALGKNADTLVDYAGALQKVTVHGDEEIIQAQALLAMFTKDEEQIKELTKATLDFADAKGIDLKSAADLMSKTIGSSTNALARYGIEVKGSVGSQERFNSLLLNIDQKFGGQAYAKAETQTGKLTQASNKYSDSLERIGKLTVQVIEPIANISADVFGAVVNALLPVESSMEKVTTRAAQQKSEFEILAGTYLNLKGKVKLTTEEKRLLDDTIKELQTGYPNYLENIDLEKAGYEEAKTAIGNARIELDKYIDSLIRKGAIQANEEQLIELSKRAYEITKQRITAEEKLKTLSDAKKSETPKESLIGAGRIARGLGVGEAYTEGQLLESERITQERLYGETVEAINRLKEEKLKVIAELDAMINTVTAPNNAPAGGGGAGKGEGGVTEIKYKPIIDSAGSMEFEQSVIELNEMVDAQEQEFLDAELERYAELNSVKQLFFDSERERREQDLLEKEVAAMTSAEIAAQLVAAEQKNAAILTQLSAARSKAEFDLLAKEKDLSNKKIAIIKTEKDAIQERTEQAILAGVNAYNAEKGFVSSVRAMIKQRIRAYIAEAIAGAVSKALASVPPPFNLILAAGAGIAASAAMEAVIPSFRSGTRKFGGGVARVGEAGEELVYMPPGSNVYNNTETQRIMGTLEMLAANKSVNVTSNFDNSSVIDAVNNLNKNISSLQRVLVPVDFIDMALQEYSMQKAEVGV
jgi:hypothetical protein